MLTDMSAHAVRHRKVLHTPSQMELVNADTYSLQPVTFTTTAYLSITKLITGTSVFAKYHLQKRLITVKMPPVTQELCARLVSKATAISVTSGIAEN